MRSDWRSISYRERRTLPTCTYHRWLQRKWRYAELAEDGEWSIEIEGTILSECGISILANGKSVGVVNAEDVDRQHIWKSSIGTLRSGRYELELQFFSEKEEELFELDRIRLVRA